MIWIVLIMLLLLVHLVGVSVTAFIAGILMFAYLIGRNSEV